MKIPADNIRDVEYKITNWGDGTAHSLGWKTADANYHIWLSGSLIDNTVLFKNSLVDRGEPGYFETRRLDATNKGNAAMIGAVKAIVERDDLKAKAIAAHAAKQEAERLAGEQAAERNRLARQTFRAMRECLSNPDTTKFIMLRAELEALLMYAPRDLDERE